jgi:hypothetical protein
VSPLRPAASPLVALTALLTGCAGGAPLLYPAHTLPPNKVSFAAGTSGHFGLGGLATAADALDAAAATPGGADSDAEQHAFVQGALAKFAVAPGVAPFVAARAGLGDQNEAGLTWTGRSIRIDGRHAFEWRSYALSLGIAGIGGLARPGDQPPDSPMGVDTGLRAAELSSLRGYGFELPVVFGYRSDADVVMLWVGARGGFERDTFNFTLVESPAEAYASNGDASRYWVGGLLGFAIGLQPIQVRVEIDAAYESVSGHVLLGEGEAEADVRGLSLTPAMAISAKF